MNSAYSFVVLLKINKKKRHMDRMNVHKLKLKKKTPKIYNISENILKKISPLSFLNLTTLYNFRRQGYMII